MMKKILVICVLFIASITQAKEHKVVFNCSSGDANYIKTRMWLVGKTMDMIEDQGDKATVALTIHGSCIAMVSNNYKMIVPDEDIWNIKKSQEYLIALSKRKNIDITVCAMSLASHGIKKSEVLPSIKISKNSFIDTIQYQNDGYAIMTFK